ncbi:histidine acid phosphatase [Colletotrichum caudatum]|nr:histidine acid phosphatase [Colletotrichum caudatum]
MSLVLFLWLAVGFIFSNGQALDDEIIEPKSHFWHWYSPYYPVPSEIDPAIPAGCKVTFVQVLSRHASRYPKMDEMQRAETLLDRIRPKISDGNSLEILMSNDLIPHEFEKITPFGKEEAVASGKSFYKRYHDLAVDNEPFIRSIDEDRVLETASLWKKGYSQLKSEDNSKDLDDSKDPDDKTSRWMQIIPTTKGFNNSLHFGGCPAFDKTANELHSKASLQWMNESLKPIIARLNKNLLGGDLTSSDIQRLMRLCPINTVINGTQSKVCDLFTTKEFQITEYGNTVGEYYSWGPGNPLGVTQGVGFTNELIARLTGKPVVDHTSTNTTLTRDPATFPLNRKIYADFSRSNMLPLNKTEMTPLAESGGFSMSRLIPFASRMYVEKLKCSDKETDEELVRVLINNRVMPLSGCDVDKLGRCKLEKFIQSLKFARVGGHWNKCFE